MMICKLKIDSKGRVQLPKSFLDANEIPANSMVEVQNISTSNNAVRLVFDKQVWKMREEKNG